MSLSRRNILKASAGVSFAAVAGCEKLVSLVDEQLGQVVPDHVSPPQGVDVDPTHHLLSRAGYGPWPGDVEAVRSVGHEAWIEQQLKPESIDDSACDLRSGRAEVTGAPGEAFELKKAELRSDMARHTLLRAVYSRRQLFESMVDFWSDHLNININKGNCIYLKPWDDHHVIRAHAMGNFRDLIRASAKSPAMLVYLDGAQNKRRKPTDIPNENYARELLELHTLGVHGGYTQRDVYEAARALTGWRVRKGLMKGSVYFDPSEHDHGSKTLLGHVIVADQNEKDLDDVIDIVCRHPSTAKHIASKLVRRFVSEEPNDALIAKTADAFTSSDGDIRQTIKVVFTSPEFNASAGMKFKTPFRFVVSALRATGADTFAHHSLIEYLTRMGQGVFQYPTPDGYPDKTSPWLGTLLWRWNFAFALASNHAPAVEVPLEKLSASLGATGSVLVDRLFEQCVGRAPTGTESTAITQSIPANAHGLDAARHALAMAMASPAFQRC